ncbi:TonB-dependent receptor domain-containing protein [Sphingomicrobium arenosum]|uniref:TonB-dependent receptor domain-containing protein n=1 Tax=Sphingomicrobium arenosum TaxID=2233861 RepID=UPI00223EBC37|nr:TonB-dependent receptor [Sphingomicrobium arenosum]
MHSAAPVALIGAFAFAQPAFAQQTESEEDPVVELDSEVEVESGDAVDPGDAIVITGSRIRRPNLESALPVTAVGGEEFFETGSVSVGDTLNDLPALRSTFSQANSTRFLGTAGLNLLDLRGLGTERTLVLQDGRRHVGGDVLSTGVSVDVNSIPTDLIERVEVVTGGSSAVYGSDAIAGVVNFIMKKDFEGLSVRGQGGISKYGDAGNYFISGVWGKNFADGRGNIAISGEYARADQYWGDDRAWIRDNPGFITIDTDGATDDGAPDNIFVQSGVFGARYGENGTLRFPGTGNVGSGLLDCGSSFTGRAFDCPYVFDFDGNLSLIDGQLVGTGPTAVILGGTNGVNFNNHRQVQMMPNLDRYAVNLLAHFEVTPAVQPFVEAKYVRTEISGSGSSGPAFIYGDFGGALGDIYQYIGGYNREQISINNPYLTDQARQLIIDINEEAGNTVDDDYRFSVRQSLLGLGSRTEVIERDLYRIVGGVRGDLGGPWNYEVAVNYGELQEANSVQGNLDAQRFLLALDAVVDPDTGDIVCNSQIDPDAAVGYYPWFFGDDPNGDARLAADVANCVPINILGGGNITQAARDYVLLDGFANGFITQFDATAFIAGDTSGFFELPGGPIGIVLGAEYREDDIEYRQDEDIQLGYTFYNAIPTFSAESQTVKEAFGEIRLPIVNDVPFFEELEVSAAARVSDYELGTTGTVWAYNVNGFWSPVDALRFRGSWARAVRAPNQGELLFPFSQNFAPGFGDPCSEININNGTSNRAANCAAAGRPADYDFRYSASLEIRSGGNPLLQRETSDSLTLGAIFQPDFLPGLSISADYYDIVVNDVISSVSAQTIVNQCYDLAAGNPYCDLFERAGPGGGPNGEEEFRILEGSLIQSSVNFAKLTARGVDMEVAYRGEIWDGARFDTRLTYTHVFDNSGYLNPTDPDFENVYVSELGDPRDAFNWNNRLELGAFTLGYQLRYLSPMYIGSYESMNSVNGDDPQNPDQYADPTYPPMFYHDVRVGIDAGDDYNFYVGIDNLTSAEPPYGLSGIGGGSAIYNSTGRMFYAGFSANF